MLDEGDLLVECYPRQQVEACFDKAILRNFLPKTLAKVKVNSHDNIHFSFDRLERGVECGPSILFTKAIAVIMSIRRNMATV